MAVFCSNMDFFRDLDRIFDISCLKNSLFPIIFNYRLVKNETKRKLNKNENEVKRGFYDDDSN